MPLKVEVTTPFGAVIEDEFDMVVLPAFRGELGILPGHTAYLTRLLMGVMRLKRGEDTVYLAANGGVAEINNDNVLVLCETCERAEDIDLDRAESAKSRAQQTLLKENKSRSDMLQARVSLQKALLRLKTARIVKR